jgi:hypothetical protein
MPCDGLSVKKYVCVLSNLLLKTFLFYGRKMNFDPVCDWILTRREELSAQLTLNRTMKKTSGEFGNRDTAGVRGPNCGRVGRTATWPGSVFQFVTVEKWAWYRSACAVKSSHSQEADVIGFWESIAIFCPAALPPGLTMCRPG